MKNDLNHPSAVNIEKDILEGKYDKMVTTNYVLDELFTLLIRRVPLEETIRIGDTIKISPNIRIIWILEALEATAWEFFKTQQDKTYSFTDCTSFVVMLSLGVNVAFSYDSLFEQAGFQVIG